jgi:type I restriction enzyme, S subunit
MSFPKYEAYKDSGVEWLGEVPEHWTIGALKHFIKSVPGAIKTGPFGSHLKSDEMTEGPYKVFNQRNVIDSDFNAGDNYITESKFQDLSAFRTFPGDILVTTRGTIGRAAILPMDAEEGVLHPCLLRVQVEQSKLQSNYLRRLIQESHLLKTQLILMSNATTIEVIYSDTMANLILPVPPLSEQTQIARFLDYETARIDALIAEQQRLIELLKEKRQAVISHAVTKGLDPTAPMKDSGVEWLGEVPEHWKILKLARVLQTVEQGWSPNASSEAAEIEKWGVIKISAVKKGNFVETENKALLEDTLPDSTLKVRKGDLLVTRANTPDLVGDTCVVDRAPKSHLMLSDLTYRLGLNDNIDARFICFFLLSSFGRAQIKGDARGSSMSMAKISQGHIKGWIIALPEYDEQLKITEHLSVKLEKMNCLMETCSETKQLLQERRSALISAAVTGKIDVRGWQAPAPALEVAHG